MKFSVYLNGKNQQDAALKAFAKACDGIIYEQGRTLVGGITVVAGLDHDSLGRIKQCQKEGRQFVFLDHAYFNRGYKTGNFRVCLNGVHQSTLLEVPGDRLERLGLQVKPWRTGREIVVLAPSERVCDAVGVSKRWAQEIAGKIGKYTGRPVRLKFKGPGLGGELKDAHCVVSLSSVAEVEAALIGVPVFTSEYSPASPIAEHDFLKIESPIYPDREPWLKNRSYSQWNIGEFGEAIRHLQRVLNGDLNARGAGHSSL